MSKIALPDLPDREAMKRLLDEVFWSDRYPIRCIMMSHQTYLTLAERDEYYTLKAFRRIMGQLTERQVALLVHRFGLDGSQPMIFKQIGPRLTPPIKTARTHDLYTSAMADLRGVIVREHVKVR